jgi:hypothetical protein
MTTLRRLVILSALGVMFSCNDEGGGNQPQALSPAPDFPSINDGGDDRDPTGTGGSAASGGTTSSSGGTGDGAGGDGMGGLGGEGGAFGGLGGMGGGPVGVDW